MGGGSIVGGERGVVRGIGVGGAWAAVVIVVGGVIGVGAEGNRISGQAPQSRGRRRGSFAPTCCCSTSSCWCRRPIHCVLQNRGWARPRRPPPTQKRLDLPQYRIRLPIPWAAVARDRGGSGARGIVEAEDSEEVVLEGVARGTASVPIVSVSV
ncbi:hypothetical protein B0H13DRAFT_2048111, partial [Mycena leptocephala]